MDDSTHPSPSKVVHEGVPKHLPRHGPLSRHSRRRLLESLGQAMERWRWLRVGRLASTKGRSGEGELVLDTVETAGEDGGECEVRIHLRSIVSRVRRDSTRELTSAPGTRWEETIISEGRGDFTGFDSQLPIESPLAVQGED
jgi:hypothetical protein